MHAIGGMLSGRHKTMLDVKARHWVDKIEIFLSPGTPAGTLSTTYSVTSLVE